MTTSLPALAPSYDVIICGARAAGAATAMLLARSGLSVLAVDRSPYGSDTLSTHALMRGGVVQLHRWGVLDAIRAAGTPRIRRVSFHYGGERVDVPLKARDGVEALFAPRRTLLDARLVDAARAAGAVVMHGLRVTDLVRDARGRVSGVVVEDSGRVARQVAAGLVIGADGAHSLIARLAGAETYRRASHAGAVIYGYFAGLPDDAYHWLYRADAAIAGTTTGASVGLIPTNDGLACVFASMPASHFMWDLRRDLPGSHRQVTGQVSAPLADRLSRATAVGGLRGFAGTPGFFRQSWGAGWALVGDAGYFKDPITAHGLTDALRDAELLARAVTRGTEAALEDYQQERDELSMSLFEATDEIASFAWTLDRLKELHYKLSKEMQREVAHLHAPQETMA